jgi:hypothetical protein
MRRGHLGCVGVAPPLSISSVAQADIAPVAKAGASALAAGPATTGREQNVIHFSP